MGHPPDNVNSLSAAGKKHNSMPVLEGDMQSNVKCAYYARGHERHWIALIFVKGD